MQRLLEETPLIVELRFLRRARSPERRVFDDADSLETYLRAALRPGDALWIWRYDRVCQDATAELHGKRAGSDGQVPEGGAY